MKQKKFIPIAVVVFIMMSVILSLPVSAYNTSGTVGTVNWTIDANKVMTVSGTGEMTSDVGSIIQENNVTKVIIENGITGIGDWTFDCCNTLTSIEIPASVTGIGESAFDWCDNLTAIEVAPDNMFFCSENGILFNKNKTTTITYPCGKKESTYAVPFGVSSIGNGTFSHCSNLRAIEIPASVTDIGDRAFSWCSNLLTLKIPSDVTNIGEGAFYSCDGLTAIEIPSGVTHIREDTFGWCESLSSITIPSSVTSIGDWAFDNCIMLSDIHYNGTDFAWNQIAIGENNSALNKAAKHFYTPVIGTPLGNVLYTDIVTYINNHAIRSYNIDGYTYIVAEDLLNYGFIVTWDGVNRRLTVGSCVGDITSTYRPEVVTHIPGEIAMSYLYTDITAWLGDRQVTAYNIGGYTCIGMDDFAARYADTYYWDNVARSLRMTVHKVA